MLVQSTSCAYMRESPRQIVLVPQPKKETQNSVFGTEIFPSAICALLRVRRENITRNMYMVDTMRFRQTFGFYCDKKTSAGAGP